MIKYTIKFESSEKFCCWRHRQKLWRKKFFQSTFILKRPIVAIVADIIEIAAIFIESRKGFSEALRKYYYKICKSITWKFSEVTCSVYLYKALKGVT